MNYRAFAFSCVLLFFSFSSFSQNIGDVYPDSKDILLKGYEYYQNGDYARAAEEYARIPEGDTLYVIAVYERALALGQDSLYEDAFAALRSLDDYRSGIEQDIMILEAANLERLGREEEARQRYDALLNQFGHSNRGYYERSVLESELGHYQEAISDLTESLQLNPFHTSTHMNIGVLAAHADQTALAVMAFYFAALTVDNNPQLVVNLIATIESLANGEYSKDENKVIPENVFAFANDLSDINEVILSRTALSDKYKSKVKPGMTYMKTLQVTCEMLKDRPLPDNYLLSFYMNYYQQMWKKNQFIGLAVLPLGALSFEETTKTFNKYKKQANAAVSQSGDILNEVNREVYYQRDGKRYTDSFLFRNGKVTAAGAMDAQGNGNGYWRFFHDNGVLSTEGELRNNEREGLWKAYSERGVLVREEEYKTGKIDGIVRIYHPTGLLEAEYTERNGMIDGVARQYYASGTQETEFSMKNGQLIGTYYSFDASGYKDSELDVDAKGTPTSIRVYNPDGSLVFESPLTDGKISGYIKRMGENGKVESEGNMTRGQKTGPWKAYHQNGQLASEGNYDNDKLTGEWKYYDREGRLIETNEYKNNKYDGISKEYDRYGKLISEITYRNGRGVGYTFYDADGKVLTEAKSTGGKLEIRTFNELRYLASEGMIEKDERVGPWKFYTLNGALESESVYKNGNLEGLDTDYHITGGKSAERFMKDGVQQGFYRDYGPDGRTIREGYAKDGDRHGPWRQFYENGKLEEYAFYWNGKLNGRNYEYGYNGELLNEYMYDDGVLLYVRSYDRDGKVIRTCHLDKGSGDYITYHLNGNVNFQATSTHGYLNGRALGYDPDGTVQSDVEWKYGKRHGSAKYYDRGRLTSEGNNYYGDKDGEWKDYDLDGNLYRKNNYFRGELTGSYIIYHPNGKVFQERNYYMDERDGEMVYYAEDGTLMARLSYIKGILLSYTYLGKDGKEVKPIALKNETGKVKAYYPNGNVSLEIDMYYGEFNGVYRTYFPNGKLREETLYEKEESNGTAREFHPNGQLRETIDHSDGEQNGVRKRYYDNGKLRSEETMVGDKRHGPASYYDKAGKVVARGEYYYDEFYAQ